MRAAALASRVAASGAWGAAEQESRMATMVKANVVGASFIWANWVKANLVNATGRHGIMRLRSMVLSPHRPLAFQHSFQRGPCFPGQMIRLFVCRILPTGHVGAEGLHRIRDQRRRVTVSPHKLRGRCKGKVHNIVEYEHLSVAIRPSADADSRSLDLGRNHGGNFAR